MSPRQRPIKLAFVKGRSPSKQGRGGQRIIRLKGLGMHEAKHRSVENRSRPAAETARTTALGPDGGYVDIFPEPIAQRRLADALNNSPRQVALRQLADAVNARSMKIPAHAAALGATDRGSLGRVPPTMQLKDGLPVNDDRGQEREADVMGAKAEHTPELGAARRPAEVFQFAKLNLRAKDGTISGISAWPNRPSSNVSGSQGQHLTAYVAFKDMILSHVRDRSVAEAASALSLLLDEILKLPGAESLHKNYIDAAVVNQKLLKTAAFDNDAGLVGGVIDNILTLRNQLPDTALATAEKTEGHGEAGESGRLEVLETALRTGAGLNSNWGTENQVADQALFAMWRLFDYQPKSGGSEAALEKTAKRVLRHVKQMSLSYPQVFAWLTDRKSWLMPYLAKNRTSEGMPLSLLSNDEIKLLTEYVHNKL